MEDRRMTTDIDDWADAHGWRLAQQGERLKQSPRGHVLCRWIGCKVRWAVDNIYFRRHEAENHYACPDCGQSLILPHHHKCPIRPKRA
jgi:hypothetical protein